MATLAANQVDLEEMGKRAKAAGRKLSILSTNEKTALCWRSPTS